MKRKTMAWCLWWLHRIVVRIKLPTAKGRAIRAGPSRRGDSKNPASPGDILSRPKMTGDIALDFGWKAGGPGYKHCAILNSNFHVCDTLLALLRDYTVRIRANRAWPRY